MSRIVLHIDMDAFFASVEERDKPRLKGRPIVVGSDPAEGKGRGVVSTANYLARAYGIKSAMPISRAWDKSQAAKKEGKPEVVFMEPDIRRYSEVSREIFGYIVSLPEVRIFESGGIDEGYAELVFPVSRRSERSNLSASGGGRPAKGGQVGQVLRTSSADQFATSVAHKIKKWVREEKGLTCSIGIGPNKLIAKIAAGKQKPDGLTIVRDEEVRAFLDPLSVRELPGIGPKTEVILNKLAIIMIAELRDKSREFLIEHFGKHGGLMYDQARGVDESPLVANREAKSVGEQITFDKDTLDAPTILATFKQMAMSVARQIKREGVFFKTIAIIVRFADFDTKTRSHTLKTSSNEAKVLETEALQLFMPFLDSRENPKRKKIRLVGVRAENLELLSKLLETKLF